MVETKVAVFIDGNNLFYLLRDRLNWAIDYKKFLDHISRYGQIVDAYFYIGLDNHYDYPKCSFLDYLTFAGFTIISKDVKCIFDDKTNSYKYKANLDIEIVLSMFNTIENYDMAILVSGDGDFERPLQLLRSRGKMFKVYSSEGFIAKEIRRISGMHFVDLQDVRSEIERINC